MIESDAVEDETAPELAVAVAAESTELVPAISLCHSVELEPPQMEVR